MIGSNMIMNARFVHTNLIARDWQRLARFYQDVFGCVPVPPERNLSGPDYERGTGVPGARAQGVHLLLPGCGEAGPTLEIFQYTPPGPEAVSAVNGSGFGHIAFAVPSVAEARTHFLAAGGSAVGEVVSIRVAADAVITWCYVRDPEGNVVELQSRSPLLERR
jgi:catechol 2,3-dioxygenase-like lactoylglutathione lyase family enzyme